jgi:hypothetical protein
VTNKPTIFAKFTENAILGEGGRLLFSLLQAFSGNGYPINLFNNLSCEVAGHIGRMTFCLPGLALVDSGPEVVEDKIYLYDSPDAHLNLQPWLKTIAVRFDIFSKYWFDSPVMFPYPIHPVHTGCDLPNRLLKLREHPKRVRVFFSGDLKGYTQNHITYPATKLPRLVVINTIRQVLPDSSFFLGEQQDIDTLFSDGFANRCVLIDTGKTWIDDRFWLDYLAKADFFLAPPGICMPMCHNIIEAMAVGAIPITSYPEWFRPHLRHMENCIVYSDAADLVEKMKFVLAMEQPQIRQLRKNVIRFFEEHLAPARFIARLEYKTQRHVDILLITESYVKRNASRLNKHSFLIREGHDLNGTLMQRINKMLVALFR